jgi:hypothetical protein
VLTVASGRLVEVIVVLLFGAFLEDVGAVVHVLDARSEVVGDVVAVSESRESVIAGVKAVEEASSFPADDVRLVAVCACVLGLIAAAAEDETVARHVGELAVGTSKDRGAGVIRGALAAGGWIAAVCDDFAAGAECGDVAVVHVAGAVVVRIAAR